MGKQSIGGLVANRADAEKIITSLVEAGVNPNEISILSSQEEEWNMSALQRSSRNWRTEKRVPNGAVDQKSNRLEEDKHPKLEKHTHAAEGATAGATTGGVLGGTLGLLVGIGVLAIPGIGPLVAAGPLMAALSGIGAGGTIGSILGALIGVGIPEKEAQHYEHGLKKGSILISAWAYDENQVKRIVDILQEKGAQNISVSAEAAPSKIKMD